MQPPDLHTRVLSRRDWLFAAALAALTVVVYLPSLGYEFVNWDDPLFVTDNVHIAGGLTSENIRWALTSYEIAYWIPLTWLSFQLDAAIWGLDATGFHLTNLVVHAINAGLMLLVLLRLGIGVGPSCVAAAVWALHPQHVESVAWVTERKDVLCVFWGLLAVWAYVRHAESPTAGRMTLVCVLTTLSLMAKPTLITFPVALLALDFWPLGRLWTWRDLGPRLREKAILITITVGMAGFTLYTQSQAGATRPEDLDRPAEIQAVNAVVNGAIHVRQAILPVSLAPLYPRSQRSASDGLLAALVLLGISAAVIALRRRAPYLLMGWLWFVVGLLPVLGLAAEYGPHAYADRNTYWPHVMLFAALVLGLRELLTRLGASHLVQGGIAVAVIVLCLVLTVRQEAIWRDSASLWEHTLAVTTDNGMAHLNLGVFEYNRGRIDVAVVQLREAARLGPNHFLSQAANAEALDAAGARDEAERSARAAAEIGPPPGREARLAGHIAAVWRVLGDSARRQNRNAEALDFYRRSLEARETWATWNKQGVLQASLGRSGEASASFTRARALEPGSGEVAFNLGLALLERGEWAAAVPPLDDAVRLAPTKPNNLGMLAVALLATGRTEEATRTATAATRLDRTWPARTTAFAWTIATHPDPVRRKGPFAYWLARTASLIAPTIEALDAAAAGAAGMGRFEEAATLAGAAATAAEKAGRGELAAAIRQRVELYHAKQSFPAKP